MPWSRWKNLPQSGTCLSDGVFQNGVDKPSSEHHIRSASDQYRVGLSQVIDKSRLTSWPEFLLKDAFPSTQARSLLLGSLAQIGNGKHAYVCGSGAESVLLTGQLTWTRSRQTVELPLACKLPRYPLLGSAEQGSSVKRRGIPIRILCVGTFQCGKVALQIHPPKISLHATTGSRGQQRILYGRMLTARMRRKFHETSPRYHFSAFQGRFYPHPASDRRGRSNGNGGTWVCQC